MVSVQFFPTKQTNTYSKSEMETKEKGVKYVKI